MLEVVPLEDPETYEKVFHSGLTSGVFQFESSGMRDVLRRYKPNSIEGLTALNALYRPGPIQGGMIDDFIERKHGRRKIEYELPELKEILEETLGVIRLSGTGDADRQQAGGLFTGRSRSIAASDGQENPEETRRSASEVDSDMQSGHSWPSNRSQCSFSILSFGPGR